MRCWVSVCVGSLDLCKLFLVIIVHPIGFLWTPVDIMPVTDVENMNVLVCFVSKKWYDDFCGAQFVKRHWCVVCTPEIPEMQINCVDEAFSDIFFGSHHKCHPRLWRLDVVPIFMPKVCGLGEAEVTFVVGLLLVGPEARVIEQTQGMGNGNYGTSFG